MKDTYEEIIDNFVITYDVFDRYLFDYVKKWLKEYFLENCDFNNIFDPIYFTFLLKNYPQIFFKETVEVPTGVLKKLHEIKVEDIFREFGIYQVGIFLTYIETFSDQSNFEKNIEDQFKKNIIDTLIYKLKEKCDVPLKIEIFLTNVTNHKRSDWNKENLDDAFHTCKYGYFWNRIFDDILQIIIKNFNKEKISGYKLIDIIIQTIMLHRKMRGLFNTGNDYDEIKYKTCLETEVNELGEMKNKFYDNEYLKYYHLNIAA
jgi:hypothetical protein